MPVAVNLYQLEHHHRSLTVIQAMAKGIRRVGDHPVVRPAMNYRPSADLMVFYGLSCPLAKAIRRHTSAGGTAVYIDLGYWQRRKGGRYSGYHKVAVNSRHPTAYFQNRQHEPDRFRALGISLLEWRRNGRHILVAGMGDKGSIAEGFQPGQWERDTIELLRKYTDRPIIYRPKPSWQNAKPIEGSRFSPAKQKIDDVLLNCYAVVTHHSNVAVGGLMEGIPAFCFEGVATAMALSDLSRIEHPEYPVGRHEWACAIAYCQWSVEEMAEGKAWRYLKDEGLVPCD